MSPAVQEIFVAPNAPPESIVEIPPQPPMTVETSPVVEEQPVPYVAPVRKPKPYRN